MFSSNLSGINNGSQTPGQTDPLNGLDVRNLAFKLGLDSYEGTNNNIFIDSSPSNVTITPFGNVTQGPVTPFSHLGFSGDFDGVYDYLTTPNIPGVNFDIEDFKIEFWIRPMNWGSNGCGIIGQKLNDTTNGWVIYNNTSGGSTKMTIRLTSTIDFASSSIVDNYKWQHWCLSRKNNVFRWFKNGVLDATLSANYNISDSTALLTIGHTQTWTGNAKFMGKISNIHIEKGIGIDSDFTPPMSTPNATQYTQFLGLCDNRFIDRSINNAQFTIYGNTDCSNVGPFKGTYDPEIHGGSLYFDGTGDYLKLQDHPNIKNLNTAGAFTIEFFFKPIRKGAQQELIYFNGDTTGYAEFNVYLSSANEIVVSRLNGSSYNWLTVKTAFNNWYQWNHLAIVKNNLGIKVYLNGKLILTENSTPSNNITYSTSCIGSYNNTYYYYKGYIAGLRIIKGVNLYTGEFPFPVSMPTVTAETTLLLKATNANIVDLTGKHNINVAGNVAISSTVKRDEDRTLYFDGAGDYLGLSLAGMINGTSYDRMPFFIEKDDFSFEASIFMTVHNATRTLFSTYPNSIKTPGNNDLYISSTGEIWYCTTGVYWQSGAFVHLNEWNHIYAGRKAGVMFLYLNGSYIHHAAHTQSIAQYSMNIGSNKDGSEGFLGHIHNPIIHVGNSRFDVNIISKSQTEKNEFKNSATNPHYQYEILSVDTDKDFVKDIVDLSGNSYTIDKQLDNISFSLLSPYSRGKKSLHISPNTAPNATGIRVGTSTDINYYGKKTTVEFWVFPNHYASTNSYVTGLLANTDASGNLGQIGIHMQFAGGYNKAFTIGVYSTTSNSVTYTSGLKGLANRWNHVVVQIDCRTPGTANEIIVYVNGKKETFTKDFSGMLATSFPATLLSIGGNGYYNNYFNGYIHDLRIVQSDTDYVYNTDTIELPTAPHPVIPGTVLHLDSDSGFMVDKGPRAYKLSQPSSGNAIENCMVPFTPFEITEDYDPEIHGGSALLFAAINSTYVPTSSVASPNASGFTWTFGSATDYTIEFAVNWPRIATGNERVLTLSCPDGNELVIGRTATNVRMYWRTMERGVAYIFNPGSWYHIALVRKNNQLTCYINGKSVQSYGEMVNWSFNGFRLGMKADGTEKSRCHLTHLHICTKALYEGEFIPSYQNMVAIPESKLLFKFRGGSFVDRTGNFTLIAETPAADMLNGPYVSGSESIPGVYPINLNTAATTCGISLIGNRHITLGSCDFTIEFTYKKLRTTASVAGILRDGLNGSSYSSIFIADASNVLNMYMSTNGSSWDIANNLVILNPMVVGSTYNVVVRKVKNVIVIFVNGVYRTHVKSNNPFKYNADLDLVIGSSDSTMANPGGEVSQLRITQGKARYIDNVIDI